MIVMFALFWQHPLRQKRRMGFMDFTATIFREGKCKNPHEDCKKLINSEKSG